MLSTTISKSQIIFVTIEELVSASVLSVLPSEIIETFSDGSLTQNVDSPLTNVVLNLQTMESDSEIICGALYTAISHFKYCFT